VAEMVTAVMPRAKMPRKDDWRVFHDQGNCGEMLRRLPTPLVHRTPSDTPSRTGGSSSRPELNVARKSLGARRRASAEVTFDLMTVASRDRIAMSQAPITPTKRNTQ